jgi:hypothetical protein
VKAGETNAQAADRLIAMNARIRSGPAKLEPTSSASAWADRVAANRAKKAAAAPKVDVASPGDTADAPKYDLTPVTIKDPVQKVALNPVVKPKAVVRPVVTPKPAVKPIAKPVAKSKPKSPVFLSPLTAKPGGASRVAKKKGK